MIFLFAYELCCVDKMKLLSSILASALVVHLVHSIVIKINPIRVQVRPNLSRNTSSSAGPFSSEISAQHRTTTDKLASNASLGPGEITKNRVATDRIATEQSFESRASTENGTSSYEMASQQPSGTASSAEQATAPKLNATEYVSVTESSAEYQTSTKQLVTLQPADNESSIFLVTTGSSTTKDGFGGDGSTRYSNVTGEGFTKQSSFWHITDGGDSSTRYSNVTGEGFTKQSSFWHITDEIATNGSTFEHEVYAKTHSVANATSKSPKAGPACKIAYPLSSTASKDESASPNKVSDAISKSASTVTLSSVQSSAFDIRPDFAAEVTTEANPENLTKGFENADESKAISSSTPAHSVVTHSVSSASFKSGFPTITMGSLSTVDSEVQISAPQSVKTATPHSEGYPDLENENETYELGPPTNQSTSRDDKESSKGYETDREASKIEYSLASAASQSSSVSVTQNTSAASKIASVSPVICVSANVTRSQTSDSTSSVTVDSKLQGTVVENTNDTSDSSQSISPKNSESDQAMPTNVPLEGEEDQIVTTIESYSFQESVSASSTAEDKIYTSSEANDELTMQKETNTSTEIGSTVSIQGTSQPNQSEQISSIANPLEPSTNTESGIRIESSNAQSHDISSSSIPLGISISESSAANISENYTTAFHPLTGSSRATDFGPGNSSSSIAISSGSTCKTVKPDHFSCGSKTCKTVSVQRTSTTTSRTLTEEEKKVRRLTISNKNPNLAKKLTRVTPLKGNISSNAGFLMANRKYGARLFFWFVRSLHNATQAPVIVWLQGQPGWSSLVGLFEEHGPYRVVETETGIQIELREHAWTNEFNVLYLDHCIGCGYSTAMRRAAYEPTFEMVSANVYQALVQFFGVFSEYADNEVYLAGEHGCAKYIPVIADTIHSKNAIQPEQINLRGMLIGGPYIDAVSMTSYSEYLYVIGLIDEHEHENLFIQEQYAQSLILATKYNETIAYLKENVYKKFEQAGYQRLYDLRYEKPMHGHYTFERYMQKVVKYEPFVASIHAEGLQYRTQSEILIEEIMKPVDNVLTTILQHYKVIQRDVESYHKTVQSVVKLCEKLSQSNAQTEAPNGVRRESPLQKAQRWERRWQQLYLRCIEWQCYIEQRLEYLRFEYSDDTGAESDDEQPASKNPRLNCYVPDTCLSVVKNCEDSDIDSMMDTDENILSALNDRTSVARDLKFGDDTKRLDSNCCNKSERNALPIIELNDNFHSTLLSYEGKMLPDGALFNRTVNNLKNVGVHYIRHEDTDPELEKQRGEEGSVHDCMESSEESLEDEWTYTNATGNDSMETELLENDVTACDVQMPVESSEELRNLSKIVLTDVKLEPHSIQKLVEQADELVQSPKKSTIRQKYPSYSSDSVHHDLQVLEWLQKTRLNDDYYSGNSVGDSCDASGEYTTEDDDQYERLSSCDQTLTMMGSSQDNSIDVSPVNEEPKVMLRAKGGSKKQRPFSTSGLTCLSRSRLTSELAHASPRGSKLTSMQWVSESALQDTLTSSLTDAHGALSSSTVEECTTQTLESSGCSINSLRRRKLKQRRRSNMGRKAHSGSADSLSSFTYRDSSGSVRLFQRSPIRLSPQCVKSDAFSEPMTRPRFASVERAIVSDPANCVPHSTSGTETEEELSNSRKSIVRRKLLQLPAFRLGPHHGAVTCRDKIAFSATSAEEQLSSFSEHAWDDFQERYVSEAYSEEPVDPDQVKKVTEFGEDYRNYIDSHSDCASSFTKRSYPIFGHSTLTAGDESSPLDSDSELEDVRNFLEKSRLQLRNAEELFTKQSAKPSSCFSLLEADFAGLRSACRENIRCLKVFLERIVLDMPSYKVNIESMLEKWDSVESRTDELERKCLLYRKIVELRKQLLDITGKVSNFAFNIEDSNQLEQNVLLLKNELDHVNDKKAVISDYNFQVHQLSKDSKYSSPPLTEDINDLYRIWEETHQKIFNQLTNLQKALWTWRQFDIHMLELKTVLREDHTALNVLDRALKQEQCNSEEVALTVKNIAKYLPDKHLDNINKINCNSTMLDTEQIDGMSTFLMNTLHVEGSFSDSGISDSGSEQDMCERERKLALLKKLARHLEALLAPGSDALRTIIKKIDEAEEEIRELQQTCRTIMKTGYLEKEDHILSQLNKSSKDNFQAEQKCGKRAKSGDPESDPHRGRSIFWRVLRASLPFHMAFVVLLFVAYLLEPNCCDAINNLNLSLTPQLRYISGPPPT